jgi:hypothetical protein
MACSFEKQRGQQDVLALYSEIAKRILITALENGAKLDDVQRTIGHANPSTELCNW